MAFLAGESTWNSADVGLQPVGEIQSKRLRRPLAMTESSPTPLEFVDVLASIAELHLSLEAGMTYVEVNMQKIFEAIDDLSHITEKLSNNMRIFADREY